MSIRQSILDLVRASQLVETLSDDTGIVRCWITDYEANTETSISFAEHQELEIAFWRWKHNGSWRTNNKGEVERWWCVPVGARETRAR